MRAPNREESLPGHPGFEAGWNGRFPLHVTMAIKGSQAGVSSAEAEILNLIASTDWSRHALDLSDPGHALLAARAVALGGVVCYGFANFYAISAHPCEEAVIHVNRSKGRPDHQVGSVTTTKSRIECLFDWSALPNGLTKCVVLDIIDSFYSLGPFGFRGPAGSEIPEHLASRDDGILTTQIIAPGYACPANRLLDQILDETGGSYLYITSANISRAVTGASEEPAHYKMAGIQQDFGSKPGFFMVAHADEARARGSFPRHAPTSTSILAFHKTSRDRSGRLVLTVERHGSLPIHCVEEVLIRYGFGAELGPKATARLPEREYTA